MVEGSQTLAPDIRLFRDVFDASPIGIAVENLEGQPLYVNPAFCAMLGFSEEELRSKHCVQFSPPEDAQKDWALFQQLKAGSIDHYQLEKRYFRKDGSLLWGRLGISLLNGRPSPLVIAMVEDITAKKTAEEAQFRHAAIVESSGDAIVSGTLDGIIVSWNAGAQNMYGYTDAEVVGKPITILAPPELPDEENKVLETVRAGGRIENFETVRVTKAGKRISVSLSISPIKDSSGAIVGLSGIARDITQRKRAEEALRQSEERFRLAAQAGKMYAYEWDIATDLVVRSEEQVNVLGFSHPKQLTRQELLPRVHPEDRALFAASVDQLTPQYPTTQLSYRVLRPDGSIVWLEKNARGFFDEQGKLLRVIGMVANITERKQAEEAVRESEEKFRSVFRDAGVGMVIVSPEGHFLAANGTFCDYLGYTEGELLAKTVESVTFSEDWPAFSHKLGEAITEGIGLWRFKKRCVHKSGRIVYTESSASLIRNYNGEPQYFVGGVLDVTMRKEAEQALADMTRKLIAAQEQERTRIARELHDDINQRLAMLAVELEQVQNDPSEIQQRLSELRKQTTEISNDVQALSHDLHSSQLEYLGAVAGMKNWCKEFGERQGMQINCRQDVRSTLPQEIGLCLFRVLQETLHNAAKHSGVKRIEVQLHEESDEIHLTIRDLGKGFDVEVAKKGRGLGLTSMQERIRLVNGTIEIQSKPMGGTTVHVRVPFGAEKFSERAVG